MRELLQAYVAWSGLVATLTAPLWVPELAPSDSWRARVLILIWVWATAGVFFPAYFVAGGLKGLARAARGRK